MEKNKLEELLFHAINASVDAGHEIMKIYESNFDVEFKEDDSPLTLADKKSHDTICSALALFQIPFLSEEGITISYDERKDWEYLWVVDPLDGTKEFIKRNGEFSINIALIENNEPIVGMVYLPTTSEGYFGVTQPWQDLPLGAIKWQGDEYEAIKIRQPRDPIIVMTSRSHGPALPKDLKDTLKHTYEQVRELPKGSSIKGCRIAEGIADLHMRRGPTSEWDTAAQQAIIEAAGGMLVTPKGKPFKYNKRETLLNGHFFVSGPELAPSVMDWYKKKD